MEKWRNSAHTRFIIFEGGLTKTQFQLNQIDLIEISIRYLF